MMHLNGRDPVVKYTVLGLLAIGLLGMLAVVIHGYWEDPHYAPPPLIAAVLGGALSTAIHLLGIVQGSDGGSSAVQLGAQVARNGLGHADEIPAARG